jgi:hypothetical protein
LFLAGSLALLVYAAKDLRAQNSSDSANPATATQTVSDISTMPPGLSYGAEEIMKLAQAKVSEETMLAFVQSSHMNYDLDALGIIYLRQQGVPDPVVTAMLQKSKEIVQDAQATAAAQPAASSSTAVITPATAAPVPQPDAYAQAATDYGPAYPTYDEPAPTYVYDYSYPYYPYYPYYGWPYPVGISIGFGYGGYHHGYQGYYHGGGFHGGTGFHGTAGNRSNNSFHH